MKHIFQAHLFLLLLPIINSVRFDRQSCACNKSIFNVADNENQSLSVSHISSTTLQTKFAFGFAAISRLGYETNLVLLKL